MKRIATFLSVIALVLMNASCNKEAKIAVSQNHSQVRTFEATMPETKTTIDGLDVKWAEGDQIDVYGYTEGQSVAKAVFTLSNGAGTNSATFTGTIDAFDQYFAVYPSGHALKTSSLPTNMEINSGISDFEDQAAVENSSDPEVSLMTAKFDNGQLDFRYGVAYFKVTIPEDDITEVALTFGKSAAQKRPAYSASDGSVSANNSGLATLTAKGTFVKGFSYYIAAAPNTANKMTSLVVSMKKNGTTYNSATITHTKIADNKIELGKVYNLGTPVISFVPVINVTAPSKLEADATDGSFTYSVLNPDGVSSVSAAIKSGTWISNVAVSAGTVTFDCEANTGDERTAVITLSYTDADDVDVTITQKAAGASATVNTYILYVNNSNVLVRTLNGAANTTYFNIGTGTSTLDCQTSGYFGTATSYIIGGNSYRYARKLDNSNPLSFTVTAGATATLKFYCARRESTKTTSIRVNDGTSNIVDDNLGWADGMATLYESSLINLTAGKTYSFVKNGDNIGIFYVEVVETIE